MVKQWHFNTREEWLEGRKSYIGGSEAASILGLNQWQTNVELWERKTGRAPKDDLSKNPLVQYGHNAEKYLRELFKLDYPQYEVLYCDNNLWTNDNFPFAHASLDGWLLEKGTGRRGVLEIKTTNILRSIQREKWEHRIPDNYFIQVLHYLMVTEFDFVMLKGQLRYDYDGEIFLNTKHYYIDRADVLDDIEYLEKAERQFYEYLKNDTRPPLVLPVI
jgi:putative phage-type endonuclease